MSTETIISVTPDNRFNAVFHSSENGERVDPATLTVEPVHFFALVRSHEDNTERLVAMTGVEDAFVANTLGSNFLGYCPREENPAIFLNEKIEAENNSRSHH